MNTAKIRDLPIKIIDGDRSSRYPKRDEFQNEGILFLNTTNIVDNHLDLSSANYISVEKFTQLGKGKLQRFDIVMTTRGSIGKVALFNHPAHQTGFINAQMLIFRPDATVIDPYFLYYLFCGSDFQGLLKNFASGSAQPQLPIVDLKEIEIPCPPLPTQRKIAAILSAYDDLIENNTRRIRILEAMAQAIYREWFVNFRYPGHEGVRLVESPLGPIPEGWEVGKLGEICRIVMGQSPESKYYNDEQIGLPFHQGVSDFGSRFPTDRKFCTQMNRIAETGDILFSVRAPVGRINISRKRIIIGRGLCAIRSYIDEQQRFVFQQMQEIFQEEDMMGGGTIFKSVTKDDMQGIKMLIPPIDLIRVFEELIAPIFRSLEVLYDKNLNLRQQRDMLLPRLISGEITVDEIEVLQ